MSLLTAGKFFLLDELSGSGEGSRGLDIHGFILALTSTGYSRSCLIPSHPRVLEANLWMDVMMSVLRSCEWL